MQDVRFAVPGSQIADLQRGHLGCAADRARRLAPCSTRPSSWFHARALAHPCAPVQARVRGAAHVGLHHLRVASILRHTLPSASSAPRCSTLMRVADAGDHAHVVLHHQDGAAGRDLLDQRRDAVHVFVAHALGRLVEQHQFRLHGQGGGDLQRALAAVGSSTVVVLGETRSGPLLPAAAWRARRAASGSRRSSRNGRTVPSLRCRPMRTFSSTLMCGKTAEIWKERMMPGARSAQGRSMVMSMPLNRIWPEVGTRNLVSRLKQVVLPAPLGPISAWI